MHATTVVPARAAATQTMPGGDALVLSHERGMVAAARAGSTEAFGGLVRLHQRRAYAVARAIVPTHEDAEDVVQEAFLHAWRALDRFDPVQPFGAWLHRIVANAALDVVRRRKVRAADELNESVAMPFRDPAVADELEGSCAPRWRRSPTGNGRWSSCTTSKDSGTRRSAKCWVYRRARRGRTCTMRARHCAARWPS